jgi:hypothetical protein
MRPDRLLSLARWAGDEGAVRELAKELQERSQRNSYLARQFYVARLSAMACEALDQVGVEEALRALKQERARDGATVRRPTTRHDVVGGVVASIERRLLRIRRQLQIRERQRGQIETLR